VEFPTQGKAFAGSSPKVAELVSGLFEELKLKPNTRGTTSQEVLRALLAAVVWLYEHRAAKKHGRQAPSFHDAVYGTLCAECGHVVVCNPLFGIVKHHECALKAAEKRAASKPPNVGSNSVIPTRIGYWDE
jgi:hypothetical protein